MTQDPTSLANMHDIVLPEGVPWWPLAPGWYFVSTVVVVLAGVFAWRRWRRWRADAYRRAALRELAAARDAAAIASVLRRTALAFTPRATVAGLVGAAWPAWLEAHDDGPIPEATRRQLVAGVYGRAEAAGDLVELRAYAARWITRHRRDGDLERSA